MSLGTRDFRGDDVGVAMRVEREAGDRGRAHSRGHERLDRNHVIRGVLDARIESFASAHLH